MCSALPLHKLLEAGPPNLANRFNLAVTCRAVLGTERSKVKITGSNSVKISSGPQALMALTDGSTSTMSAKCSIYWRDKPTGNSFIVFLCRHSQKTRKNYCTYHLEMLLLFTLSRPPTSSSLRITNRSFRYASPHLWNVSFRQPCIKHPADDVTLSNSPPTSSPLSPSITHSLFHSRLKTNLFHKSFPP